MNSEIIIGSDIEPTLYRVGSYILQQQPGANKKLIDGNYTQKVMELLGLFNIHDMNETTLQVYFDTLDASGNVKKALLLLLDFHDKTPLHKWVRAIKMMILKERTLDIVLDKYMTYGIAGRVLLDFFDLNFSSTRPSKVLSSTRTSN